MKKTYNKLKNENVASGSDAQKRAPILKTLTVSKFMRHIYIQFFLLLLAAGTVQAGGNNAEIRCENSQDYFLSGDVPGDFASFNIKVHTYKGAINYNEDNSELYIAADLKKSVFNFVISSDSLTDLIFYMLPSSVKIVRNNPEDFSATFNGIIKDGPRPSGNNEVDEKRLTEIKLTCSYEYSI